MSKKDTLETQEDLEEASEEFLKEVLDLAIEHGCPPTDDMSVTIRLYSREGRCFGDLDISPDWLTAVADEEPAPGEMN